MDKNAAEKNAGLEYTSISVKFLTFNHFDL